MNQLINGPIGPHWTTRVRLGVADALAAIIVSVILGAAKLRAIKGPAAKWAQLESLRVQHEGGRVQRLELVF